MSRWKNAFLRRQCAAVFLIGALAVATPLSAARAGDFSEISKSEHIIASMTYNFARFVQWPAEAVGAGDDPIVLCVLDESASEAWERLVGKRVGARELILKILTNSDIDSSHCNMAYLSGDFIRRVSPRELSRNGVLTISDSSNFLTRGGAIQLMVDDAGGEFDISQSTLKKAGVKISSKLMRVGMRISIPSQ